MLLKSIENLLDKKLQPTNERLDKMDAKISGMNAKIVGMDAKVVEMDAKLVEIQATQKEMKLTQETIMKFITQADSEFMKLEEKTRDIEKIKRVINISNVR